MINKPRQAPHYRFDEDFHVTNIHEEAIANICLTCTKKKCSGNFNEHFPKKTTNKKKGKKRT